MICSSWVSYNNWLKRAKEGIYITVLHTFWYWSEDFEAFPDFMSASPSNLNASFWFSCSGFAPVFFAAGAFFCFLALGGVIDRMEPSLGETSSGPNCSSSESGLDRFFEAAGFTFGFRVVCAIFFAGALAAAAFLGAAFDTALGLGLDFYSHN
jgi:hypothetical protein